MTALMPILAARGSEDSMIKLIFGAIVLVFWIGGAIVSAINKRVQESKRRARYGQMPPTFQRPIPPPVPNPTGFANAPAKGKAAKKTKRKQVFATAAAAPQPPARPGLAAAAAPAPAAAAPGRSAPAAQHPPGTIARLLRRPETLRAALILNEVLSPPLSLRDGVQSGRPVE